MPCQCYIVPPHILQAIADSRDNSENQRQRARNALDHRNRVTTAREQRLDAASSGERHRPQHTQGIIPIDVLDRLANSNSVDQRTRDRARRDADHARRRQQGGHEQETIGVADPKDTPRRAVFDAQHTDNEANLPGKIVRAEGEPATKDEAVNEAYDNSGVVLKFYKDIFNWNSIDNKNMDVISSVHFGNEYENACKCSCSLIPKLLSYANNE